MRLDHVTMKQQRLGIEQDFPQPKDEIPLHHKKTLYDELKKNLPSVHDMKEFS